MFFPFFRIFLQSGVFMSISSLDQLMQLLSKLPGLGPRSARRAVLHLLKRREALMQPLIDAMKTVEGEVKACSVCGNLDVTDPCSICSDPRREEAEALCVVEDVADLWALERSHAFKGRYHVLGGTLSALDGIRPADLHIDGLVERLKNGSVREVILALNATVEGQTTAHYIAERIEPLGIKVSKLAHGLPVGGELDYLDEGTLIAALKARR
jgi:recombination protein RecR